MRRRRLRERMFIDDRALMLDYMQFVLAPQVLIGLALGIAVILVALGLTIIFGLLDVINMCHGEFYALGAFAAFVRSALPASTSGSCWRWCRC